MGGSDGTVTLPVPPLPPAAVPPVPAEPDVLVVVVEFGTPFVPVPPPLPVLAALMAVPPTPLLLVPAAEVWVPPEPELVAALEALSAPVVLDELTAVVLEDVPEALVEDVPVVVAAGFPGSSSSPPQPTTRAVATKDQTSRRMEVNLRPPVSQKRI